MSTVSPSAAWTATPTASRAVTAIASAAAGDAEGSVYIIVAAAAGVAVVLAALFAHVRVAAVVRQAEAARSSPEREDARELTPTNPLRRNRHGAAAMPPPTTPPAHARMSYAEAARAQRERA